MILLINLEELPLQGWLFLNQLLWYNLDLAGLEAYIYTMPR